MKQTLSTSEAETLLRQDGWSREAAEALVEHLEAMEVLNNVEIELDLTELRGDFREYSSALEAAKDFKIPERASEEEALEELAEVADFIPFDGGVIVEVC
jgi:hypothetical protein